MKKESFGAIVRDRRHELSLTQRGLARELDVKASYIAYLENGQRRPSLALLGRIAAALDLDRRRLFALSHPEAAAMLAAPPPSNGDRGGAWRKFSANRALLARHKVTAPELKVLKQVSTLGQAASAGQFVFILNSIRQAMEPER
ncbi:MAG: helix-turn-helix domain-containing protein [Candidatus Binataceae bacterium]